MNCLTVWFELGSFDLFTGGGGYVIFRFWHTEILPPLTFFNEVALKFCPPLKVRAPGLGTIN